MTTGHSFEKRFGFLNGGGEMGALIRSYDWSTSSLGIPEQWPQSLRTTLSIILNSNFPMFLFWGPELICFYNDGYRPSLGNNGKHPAIGKSGSEVWPEIWNFIHPLIVQVLTTGEATWHEDQFLPIYRNGAMEDVYWTFSYSPVIDESAKPGGVFVTCTETTQKVQIIRKLKESEHRFRNLVSQATVGVVVLNGDELFVDIVNERYCQLIQKPYAQVIGKRIFDVLPEADDQFRHIIDEVRLTGTPKYLYDFPFYLYLNGEKQDIYTNLVYQPYKELDGSITGVVVLAHDVTEQMRARQEIAYTEERARLAIDSAELGVYELDLISDEIITTPRFNTIFGFDQWVSRLRYVSAFHPDDMEIRNKAVQEAMISGNLLYEARLIWSDGSVHWAKVTGKVFYNEQGTPIKLLGVAQDVTEQKLFSDELAKQVRDRTRDLSLSNQELQKINDELEQFVHVSSHDLQEPIRKIRIYSDMIKNHDYHLLGDVSKRHFEKIRVSAERLSRSLKDLLSFNSLDRDEQRRPVNLNEVMDNVEIDLELIIAQNSAVISHDLLPVINGIPFQIHQLFYNLVNNALKFLKPGIAVRIDISTRRPEADEIQAYSGLDTTRSYHEIIVRDNGIGFDQKNAEKIFTMFQRLHNREAYSGTGIGLALCKKVVQNHGGRLWARSVLGEGASFHIILPE